MAARRRRTAMVAGLAAVGTAVGTALGAVSTSAAAHGGGDGAAGTGECEVRTLALPDWATDGGVMDIERVRGMGVVYYGNAIAVNPDGSEYQRAVIWKGLDSEPVVVGAVDAPDDIAFELTPSGLINGQALDPETGMYRGWVQKLLTGKLTWADPAPEGMEPVDVYFRRINDRGAAAGTAFLEDGSAALTWNKVHLDPVRLPGGDHGMAEGWDINNRREVVGSVAAPHPLAPEGLMPVPVLWDRHGRPTMMATLGLEGYPRMLNDARQAAGLIGHGDDLESAHIEAAFWPSPDRVVGLGLLPGGGLSMAFGMDEGGWVVGLAEVVDPDSPAAEPWGVVSHGFLWTGGDPDRIRVLPSAHAEANGITDWHQWYGGAAHAVHSGLNQVGTSSHAGFGPDGSIRSAPTVYLNADRCGVEVETTHTATWPEPPEEPEEAAGVAALSVDGAGAAAGHPAVSATPRDLDLSGLRSRR